MVVLSHEIKSVPPGNRIEWIDLARTFAILSVITVHSVERAYTFNLESMTSVPANVRVVCFILFTVGRLGVPLFFFITGYLLLDRNYADEDCFRFWKKNLLALLLTTEIWIVLYDLFLAWYNSEPFDIPTLIRNMLFLENVDISHYWYMPVILGVYIFVPLISAVLKRFSIKTLMVPLTIASCYLYFVPTVNIILTSIGQDSITAKLDVSFSGGATAF